VLAPFLALHRLHAATRFVHDQAPPRLTGSTWSIESALFEQYWQTSASRINTFRRETESLLVLDGARKKPIFSTAGSGKLRDGERTTAE